MPARERELAVALLRAIPAPSLPGSRPPSAAMEPTAILARLDLPEATVLRVSAALLAYRYCCCCACIKRMHDMWD